MAQFDLHRSPSRVRSRAPYLVVVQSARLDALRTRVVIPLVGAPPPGDLDQGLAPRLMVGGAPFVLVPWEIFTIPAADLGGPIGSLADNEAAARIIRALDELITRAYG